MNSVRSTWAEVPERLRARVEEILGAPVAEVVPQAGGFSTGTADLVVGEDGRRAFVKTLEQDRNPRGFGLHQQEVRAMRVLPPGTPAPRMLGAVEEDGWIALVLEFVEGHHPLAATAEETTAVLDALASLPEETPAMAVLPRAEEDVEAEAAGWSRVVEAGLLDRADPWARENIDRLLAAAHRLPEAARGNRLAHLDLRADNMLRDADGRIWLVDWPYALVGAGWLDAACWLLDLRVRHPGHDVERFLGHPVFAQCAPSHLDAFLAGLAGSFLHNSLQPAPPNMPTLRDFQRREHDAALAWLRERWG